MKKNHKKLFDENKKNIIIIIETFLKIDIYDII
jgi:hypothetical protein